MSGPPSALATSGSGDAASARAETPAPTLWDVGGLDRSPDPILVIDSEMRLVYASPRTEALLDTSFEEWRGQVPLELIHPDDLPIALTSLAAVQSKDVGTYLELRVKSARGWLLVELVGAPTTLNGEAVIVLSLRDLTERRRWEVASGGTERFRSIVEHSPVCVALADADGRIQSISGAFNRTLGHDQALAVGSVLADWVAPGEVARTAIAMSRAARTAGTSAFETTMLHFDGRGIPYQISVANLTDDPIVAGLIITASDISARRALERRVDELSTRDALTGLANRSALVEFVRSNLAAGNETAAFFVDIDRFKPLNELYGHAAGDSVLRITARRLRGAVRPEDIVARLGADEFAVVVAGPQDDCEVIARRLADEVAAPLTVENASTQLHASVGWARTGAAREVTWTPESLLAEAEAAMSKAKARRYGMAGPGSLPLLKRRRLAEDLTHALRSDPVAAGLAVYYQPVVRAGTRAWYSAEALVRWEHPTDGLLSPADFLPLATDAGLEGPLSRWILDTAVAQAARWRTVLPGGVAVNVSAAQISDELFPEVVAATLARHSLPAELLCLEVTETTVLERASHGAVVVAAALRAILATGVRIAIDDFGTGYSSLTHVRELPASVLKVDRSFVSEMLSDGASHGIVAAVVMLAHSVGLELVAEGVETEQQAEALERLDVDLLQGFWFAKPAPAAVLESVFRSRASTSSASDRLVA